jgi:hypothetical protein
MSLKDWAVELMIPYETLRYRIRRGWPLNKVFGNPQRIKTDKVEVNDILIPFNVALKLVGVSHVALYKSAKRRHLTPAQEIQRRLKETNQ